MKIIILITSLILLNSGFIDHTDPSEVYPTSDVDALAGTWKIDLRPSKSAAPYYQEMVIKSIKEKTFKGSFYGSAISQAKLNTNWDRLYFGFTTYDGSNEYYHSGYLQDGKVYGITYCPNRDFAMPWTGTKK